MKKLTPNSFRFLPAALGLGFCLLANPAGAAFTTWDPQGTTTTPNYCNGSCWYTGNLTQTWENNEWSTSQTGQATPQAWVENTAALFAVHSGTGTPAFTVTMNANHTVAGVFDGPQTPNACTVTINGTGTMLIPGSQGFDPAGSTCGTITINNVIADVPGNPGIVVKEGCGSLTLNGANTYTGGFQIDGTGSFSFGNNAAFGTGTITWLVGGFIEPATTSAYTIANAMTHGALIETFANNSGGVTFSGLWTLPATGTTTIKNFGTTAYPITVSGAISGAAALTLNSTTANYGNPWTFTGVNTFGGALTIAAGTLTIGGAGDLGDTGGGGGSYAANIINNGTFIYNSSAAQTLSGYISGSGALTQSGSGALTITGPDACTGAVTISGGRTLFLGSGGSLSSASSVSIAAGATFDVSGYGSYPLSSGTLIASGTALPATLNGPSGGTLNLQSLPITLTYDGTHAPLTITYSSGSGTLYLNGNPFEVNNASGSPLVAGAYPIIQTSGTISGSGNYFVAVTGSGVVNGDEAVIQISGDGANVNLVVQPLPNVSAVWNGADSGSNPNWSDVNNWVNQDAPAPYGDSVTFTGNTGTTPVMDSSYSVQSLTFDANTTASFNLYNSGGSVLGVQVGVTNNSAFSQVLDMPVDILSLGNGPVQWNILNSGVLITLNAPVSDDGNGLAVSGAGTLELTGANTFTGGITTASGSTLDLDGSGDLGDNGSGSGSYGGAIIDNGTFIYNSSAPQTFTGPVTVNGTFTDNISAAQTFSGSLTIGVGGTFTENNNSTTALTLPGSITDNGTFIYNGSYNPTFSQVITGSGALTVNGNGATGQGQLTLKAANTYTGITTVNDDLLLIGPTYGDSSLGTPPATPVANQLTLNNDMNDGANNFGLVDNGGNPSTLTLSTNRGIFLGANGGCISCYPGATMNIPGVISGTGPLYVGDTLVSFDGYVGVSGQSTYTGETIISGGWLNLEANNCLPAGTPLTIGSSKQAVGYGSFLNMNGFSQTIGPLSSSPGVGGGGPNVGTPAVEFGGTGTLTILQTNNTTFEGIIGYNGNAGGSVVITVPSGGTGGTLTLNNTNVYTGATTITMAPGAVSGPTLALANDPAPPSWSVGYGAISNTASISIGAGGTLDVSGLTATTWYLSSLTSLSAGGTGTAVGTTAAAINGASGGTVNLGAQAISLTFTPTTFTGDTTHPALYISQGALTLSGNAVTVNNAAGTALGLGTYTVIQVAGGSISGTPSQYVSVTGRGLVSGTEAVIQVSGGNVNLVVQPPASSPVWNGADYGTSANWSDGKNWVSTVAPDLIGDAVTFAGTVGPVPVMNNNYALYSLTFKSGAGSFTLNNSGGTVLTAGSGVTNNSTSAQTLAMPVKLLPNGGLTLASQWNLPNAAGSITVVSNISDTGFGLAVSGPGPLILSGTNNYSGPTTIGAGSTLTISGAGNMTSGSTAGTYATAITNNGAFNYNSTAAETLSGTISGSGALTEFGTGTLTLSGANTYTGITTISNGSLVISKDSNLGAAPATAVANQLTLNNYINNGANNYGLRDTGGNFTLNVNRGVYLGANGGSINVQNTYTLCVAGVITGSGSFWASPNSSAGYGTVVVSNANNNYTGSTYIGAGTLQLGVNGALPSGTPLTIGSSSSGTGGGSFLNMNGKSQTIGPLASSTGFGATGSGTPTVTLTGALTINETSSTTFAGVISGSGGSLTLSSLSTGTLTLTGVNTYTGGTTISAGTLALSSTGSISNSPTISIGAGGTFDVSGLTATTFNLSSSTTLSASGAGTGVGTTAATIKGSTTVNLESRPISLTFAPTSPYGDTTHPALYISQGALTLSGNTIAVNNASARALRTGTYTLIQVAGGTITGTPNSAVTVTGSGIGAGGTASISVSGGNVNLVVVVPAPVINSVTLSGANLIFSGTNNGSASSTYYVLTSTNVALPLSQWTNIATGTFSSGTFSVTNSISGGPRFFAIEIP